MRVIVTAGGTGGHIYPAIAFIEKIKKEEPDSEFLFIGTNSRMEKDIVPSYGIPFLGIEMIGFNRKKLSKNFKTIFLFFKNFFYLIFKIRKFKPDVVIGFGGYVSSPVITASKLLLKKTYIHEQNSIPGKANLFLSKFSNKVFISFLDSKKYFNHKNIVLTGNPASIRALLSNKINLRNFGLDDNKKTVLIVMGSLGSDKVNTSLIENFKKIDNSYQVLFVTGKKDYDNVAAKIENKNIVVVPYIENISGVMKSVDLIVTRAGATTLSELIAIKKPSIIIPSPYVADNHQYINAKSFSNVDAAILLEEKNIESLFELINVLIKDDKRLKRISENLQKLEVLNSTEIMYQNVKEK